MQAFGPNVVTGHGPCKERVLLEAQKIISEKERCGDHLGLSGCSNTKPSFEPAAQKQHRAKCISQTHVRASQAG